MIRGRRGEGSGRSAYHEAELMLVQIALHLCHRIAAQTCLQDMDAEALWII